MDRQCFHPLTVEDALVAVLLIFAARGRAIREERERKGKELRITEIGNSILDGVPATGEMRSPLPTEEAKTTM